MGPTSGWRTLSATRFRSCEVRKDRGEVIGLRQGPHRNAGNALRAPECSRNVKDVSGNSEKEVMGLKKTAKGGHPEVRPQFAGFARLDIAVGAEQNKAFDVAVVPSFTPMPSRPRSNH